MIPLTKLERRWATVALTTCYPSGVSPRVAGADVIDIGASLEDVCQYVPVRVAMGLRIGLWLFTFAPLLSWRFRILSQLDAGARERAVLAVLSSRMYVVRQLAILFKAFGALMFVVAPGVRERIIEHEPIMRIGLGHKEARHVA